MSALRPDQLAAKRDVAAAFAAGADSVVLVCPTGWGKTHFAVDLLAGADAKGQPAVFLTDREEIALDTAARARAAGVRTGLVMADAPADPDARVQVVSIPTCRARGRVPPARFAIWDECHHTASATWETLGAALHARGARSLGLTATLQRGDGQPLAMFRALVQGPSVRWCIRRGLLVPVTVVAPPDVEAQGLATSPGEAYRRWAWGQRAVVFCANVAHVAATVAEFAALGVPAEALLGATPSAQRRGARERLARGEVRALVGCGVFLEGFDAPSVECVILARPFGVPGPFLQAIGRGMRLSATTGKTACTVLDLRGSVHLHGLPDEDRAWSLAGAPVRRTEALPSLRRCACGAIFRPAARCPRCGAGVRAAAVVPRALNRAERLAALDRAATPERDRQYLARLEEIAATRLRLPAPRARAWARTQFERRRGRPPEVAA